MKKHLYLGCFPGGRGLAAFFVEDETAFVLRLSQIAAAHRKKMKPLLDLCDRGGASFSEAAHTITILCDGYFSEKTGRIKRTAATRRKPMFHIFPDGRVAREGVEIISAADAEKAGVSE